jgi:anti-anti-sigma factor
MSSGSQTSPTNDPATGPGDVMVLPHDDHTLVILYGNIDWRTGQDLEDAGRFCLHPPRPTVIDVRKITGLDSVGLSFIIRLAAGLRLTGRQIQVQGPSRRTAELLTLVGADSLIAWLPDRTETGDVGMAPQ